jgi:hypothetical protein
VFADVAPVGAALAGIFAGVEAAVDPGEAVVPTEAAGVLLHAANKIARIARMDTPRFGTATPLHM